MPATLSAGRHDGTHVITDLWGTYLELTEGLDTIE
jgi:hypothetical protein